MTKAHKIKFLTQYNLPETTELTLLDIANLSGTDYNTLITVFNRAKVYEYIPASLFSFHKKPRETKPVSDKKAMESVYEFLMGKIKDRDKDLSEDNRNNAADISGTVLKSV
jgi:hypothetical protein